MQPVKDMTIGELGAFVSGHLEDHGVKVTLTGGACVTIYSDNRYQSFDLDFIEEMPAGRKRLKDILAVIGFMEERRYFRHPETEFFLEFPPGPLSVGSEPMKEIVNKNFSTGTLRMISPTDCVKDRLAAFYHWEDRQSLEQALMVARAQEIDFLEIRRWAEREGDSGKFEIFMNLLPDKS